MTDVKNEPASPAPSRQERALATRRRMTDAACRGFSERGYAKTTMSSVAADAGVAVQTLYFTFHTKADLLQAAYEYAVAGPESTPPHLTDWWREAEAEPDIRRAVGQLVDGTMELLERAAPLVWAVRGDADAKGAYEFNERLRRDGYAAMVAFLSAKHRLRPNVTALEARDIMLTLLGPHVYFIFTRELGWSLEDVAAWTSALLLRELFDVDTTTATGHPPAAGTTAKPGRARNT